MVRKGNGVFFFSAQSMESTGLVFCDLLLNIGHCLLMVRKGMGCMFIFTAQSMESTGLMFRLFVAVVQTMQIVVPKKINK